MGWRIGGHRRRGCGSIVNGVRPVFDYWMAMCMAYTLLIVFCFLFPS